MLSTKEELKTFFLHFFNVNTFYIKLGKQYGAFYLFAIKKTIYFKISVIEKINKTDIMEWVLQFKDKSKKEYA